MKTFFKHFIFLSFFVVIFLTPLVIKSTDSILSVGVSTNQALAHDGHGGETGHSHEEYSANEIDDGDTAEKKVVSEPADVNNPSASLENYLGCGQWEFGCKILNALATMTIQVGSFLVGLSAYFMDIFLNHTLQSSSYRDSGFIQKIGLSFYVKDLAGF